jgi:8-oxo-dGTP diphosphatase
MPADILAAGGLVWRDLDGTRCLGVVRRLRLGGDYSFPKGKLEPGESFKECARREVAEELGVDTELAAFAGLMNYRVGDRDKYVLFWEMEHRANSGDEPDGREVAERLWLPPEEALKILTYRTDQTLLTNLMQRLGHW